VDEDAIAIADPAAYVLETARQKAAAVAQLITQENSPPFPRQTTVLVAADTTVVLDGAMLGKPAGAADAYRMLRRLRNRSHIVYTGLVVMNLEMGQTAAGIHPATVRMRPYSDDEIDAYIASGDPFDKAGAYAIQHPTFMPVLDFDGCYLSIMGLSICHLAELLQGLGVSPHMDMAALANAHHGYACPLWEQLVVSHTHGQ
jgi:MAF protein